MSHAILTATGVLVAVYCILPAIVRQACRKPSGPSLVGERGPEIVNLPTTTHLPGERRIPLLGGLAELCIEPCMCAGDKPCDFPGCPRRAPADHIPLPSEAP